MKIKKTYQDIKERLKLNPGLHLLFHEDGSYLLTDKPEANMTSEKSHVVLNVALRYTIFRSAINASKSLEDALKMLCFWFNVAHKLINKRR